MTLLRALGISAALTVAGCNGGGGLLEVQAAAVDAGAPAASATVNGPDVNEMVNGGTVASNAKYKVVFTLGQSTPNQGPETSPNDRVNGGIVGAMNGK
jgi:hypothetical protein